MTACVCFNTEGEKGVKKGEEEVGGVGWFWVRWEVRRYRKCDYVELCSFKQEERRRRLKGMYLQV